MFSPKEDEACRAAGPAASTVTASSSSRRRRCRSSSRRRRLREHAEYALADVDLRHPCSTRRASASSAAATSSSRTPPRSTGPMKEVPFPAGSNDLRSVPAVAAVIGAEGGIGGFTAANAWTRARPARRKSHDFALSLGPVLVTRDEYDGGGLGRARRDTPRRTPCCGRATCSSSARRAAPLRRAGRRRRGRRRRDRRPVQTVSVS